MKRRLVWFSGNLLLATFLACSAPVTCWGETTGENSFKETLSMAEQGHAGAQYNLGGMYLLGLGVPQDYLEAHTWLNLAASHSQGDAQERMAKARDRVGQSMTPSQLAEAQKLARDWKPKTWKELSHDLD